MQKDQEEIITDKINKYFFYSKKQPGYARAHCLSEIKNLFQNCEKTALTHILRKIFEDNPARYKDNLHSSYYYNVDELFFVDQMSENENNQEHVTIIQLIKQNHKMLLSFLFNSDIQLTMKEFSLLYIPLNNGGQRDYEDIEENYVITILKSMTHYPSSYIYEFLKNQWSFLTDKQRNFYYKDFSHLMCQHLLIPVKDELKLIFNERDIMEQINSYSESGKIELLYFLLNNNKEQIEEIFSKNPMQKQIAEDKINRIFDSFIFQREENPLIPHEEAIFYLFEHYPKTVNITEVDLPSSKALCMLSIKYQKLFIAHTLDPAPQNPIHERL